MESASAFSRVSIIGFGLIGASLARAIKKAGMAGSICAYDPSSASLEFGLRKGIIDRAATTPEESVIDADLVLIATPPASFAAIAQAISPSLKRGALVMDMGSVKEAAMYAIAPHIPPYADYVPAHPIAGREHTGAEASIDSLFENKRVIITPAEDVREHALHTAMLFWQALESKPEAMPADLHDVIYATVSHMPQFIAFAAKPVVASSFEQAHAFPLFERFIRLCGSNPSLWAQIFALNAKPLLVVLALYLQGVYQIISELRSEEAEAEPKDLSPEEMAFCRIMLFPRIAASCLVGAVMTTERKINLPMARYAGSGFADIACPALEAPDEDLKQISNYAAHVAKLLEDFQRHLNRLHQALQSQDIATIEAALRA